MAVEIKAKASEPQPKKKCFVMMPLGSTVAGYPADHFAHVSEFLIRPACAAAGYDPVVANDSQATEVIMAGVLKNIVDADMVLCDMSSRNPNVFYELALRQAFGKPVVLIIDDLSSEPFDVQGLRYVRYRAALRINEVPADVSSITAGIQATATGTGVSNLMDLIGMQAAKLPADVKANPETAAILRSLSDISARLTSLETRVMLGQAPIFGTGATGATGGLLGNAGAFSQPSRHSFSDTKEFIKETRKRLEETDESIRQLKKDGDKQP